MKKTLSTDLTPANTAKVKELLAGTPRQLDSLSEALSEEQLRRPLAAGERSFAESLALLLEEPLIPGVHAERQWGKLSRYDLLPFPDQISYFKIRRAVLLRVLNSLTQEGWARSIREEGKKRQESVYWRAGALAMHELEHLIDLRRKLNGGGSRPRGGLSV